MALVSRRLVTVRTVTEIVPIEGADAIEVVKVDGWQCVCKKGEFHVGQLGVYHEIDSLLPLENPAYAFLAKGVVGQAHHRLKTIRLRKALSQGLLVRLDAPGMELAHEYHMLNEEEYPDETLDEVLGVVKWEPPTSLDSGQPGSPRVITFPGYIPRTDLERVQNITFEYEQARGRRDVFEVQAKYDGSSMTAYYNPEIRICNDENFITDAKRGVCSRNQDLIENYDNAYWRAAKDGRWLDALPIVSRILGGAVALQGELVGWGIQSNRMKLAENVRKVYLFDIYSCRLARYLTMQERESVLTLVATEINHRLEEVVSMEAYKKLDTREVLLTDYVQYCQTTVPFPLEGVVFKSHEPNGLRFKAISNEYLLKYGDA